MPESWHDQGVPGFTDPHPSPLPLGEGGTEVPLFKGGFRGIFNSQVEIPPYPPLAKEGLGPLSLWERERAGGMWYYDFGS